ncbi:MAG: chemotaxis protein CheA [Deltaproteobacteria bacterium]|nr:chemotaxis protein CheA [Deltaproteobacteria bacterium]
MNDTQNFIEVYRQEADELLAEIEQTVLEIEANPEEKEVLNRLFRAVHTIKGSGAMFGFDKVVKFTHTLETVLDRVRDGILPVTKELIDLILNSKDHIKSILDCTSSGEAIDTDYEEYLESALAIFLDRAEETVSRHAEILNAENAACTTIEKNLTYRIRFRPDNDIFTSGTDPALLLKELKEFGDHQITPQLKHIPSIEKLNPEECYIYWDIILTTNKTLNDIKDVFIFIEDKCDLSIDIIDNESDLYEILEQKKIGEILIDRKDISSEELNDALKSQKRIGELLIESKKIDPETIASALTEQSQLKKIREKRHEEKGTSSLRVASEKLDMLVDLVGELVTVQARLTQFSTNMDHAELLSIAEEIERLTTELRNNTMSIRMTPIGTTFSKFKRLVRDLSSELGKCIELVTEGAETELDKTVIDRLDDPLVHLIRNCIDHGIEPPDKRIEAGKPEYGTILLSAAHKGAYVVITIKDDGDGINTDAIREKAIEKDIIQRDAILSEREIYDLIFAPGFSTALTVTNVSGRGVGMDVVKRTIESLRGSIEIDSTPGKSTSITLKLPLTLAIINGLLVTIGEVYYVLPLASVEECVELNSQTVERSHGSNILNVRGDIVPYIRLRDYFGIKEERPSLEHIVIADVHEKRIGFVVDNVIGGHQTVIKSLGPAFKHIKDISGATILGDGTVALILDVNAMV